MLSFDEKYDALVRKDATFEGAFFAAVRSTGIFCRTMCTARKPKPENVTFFDTARDALQSGYRPCRVCRPMEPLGATPDGVDRLLRELGEHPDRRLQDRDLEARGLAPSLVRRWFRRHHNMTFHAYQRMLRINQAHRGISTGRSVTASALENGYGSLSGFNHTYRSVFGLPPTGTAGKAVITIARFTTPLGPMVGGATNDGVCLCEFADRRALEAELADLSRRATAVVLPGASPHLDRLQKELAEWFEGSRRDFTVPLHAPGTPFQRQVWDALLEIPYGSTCTYKEQAVRVGRPDAVRAVASANRMNRIAILIPCHRVIGSDGSLTGYSGGLARKKWLIEYESRNSALSR